MEKNLNFEAMRKVYSGETRLFVHADYVKELLNAINYAAQYKVKMVLVGAADAYMITDLIKANKISIVLGRTHSLPSRDDEDVNMPYKMPKILQDAGIEYAMSCEGFWQTRNLPFTAGTAVAYGLTKEQALQAITLNAAKILGVDDKTGSLEVGKDANILICDGDILDMKSSNVSQAFIQGRQVSLDNKQKQLYERYKYKYGIK